jgi:hypothetical protein
LLVDFRLVLLDELARFDWLRPEAALPLDFDDLDEEADLRTGMGKLRE